MLFSPSAYVGGTAAPTAWRLAVTEGERLFLELREAQEPALAASSDLGDHQGQGERAHGGQRMTQAATDEFLRWAKGIAAGRNDRRVQAVMELSGANLQPRLTGPLLLREQAPQGPERPGPAVRAPGRLPDVAGQGHVNLAGAVVLRRPGRDDVAVGLNDQRPDPVVALPAGGLRVSG